VTGGLAAPRNGSTAACETVHRPPLIGAHEVGLPALLESLLASGFPAIAAASPSSRRALLDGYLDQIVEREFAELGHPVRRPQALRAWLTAYAAATATTTSYNRILDAATPGDSDKPAKTTTIAYRETLEALYGTGHRALLAGEESGAVRLRHGDLTGRLFESLVSDDDVAHLHWLRSQLVSDLLDAIVVTAGRDAYRRRDGVGVVPAVLLGA
jgi:hypothetical protein